MVGLAASAAALAASVRELLDSPAANRAFFGVYAVDVKTGAKLIDYQSGRYFVPASNAKIFTTALADAAWSGTSFSHDCARPGTARFDRPPERRPVARRRRSEPLHAADPLQGRSLLGKPLFAEIDGDAVIFRWKH